MRAFVVIEDIEDFVVVETAHNFSAVLTDAYETVDAAWKAAERLAGPGAAYTVYPDALLGELRQAFPDAKFPRACWLRGAMDPRRAGMLTTAQVAERLAVTESAVKSWCRRGLLPGAEALGTARRHVWLIPEEALRGFEPPQVGRPSQCP